MERSRRKVDALLLAWTAWMADREPRPLRKKTREVYRSNIRRAIQIAEAGGYSILNADVRTLRYVIGVANPHPSTHNSYLSAFRCFYEFLIQQGLRKDNPAKELGRPPAPRAFPRPINVDDCCRYLDTAREMGMAYYAIACLGFYMGLRRSEIRSLRWADFFQAEGRLWLDFEGKGGKRARLPVPPAVAELLVPLRQATPGVLWLFPSPVAARWGEPVCAEWVYVKHREIAKKAGIPKGTTLHQLRHTFAQSLRAAGGDLAVVQKGLRHASPNTSMIYMDLLPGELAMFIDRIDYQRREA